MYLLSQLCFIYYNFSNCGLLCMGSPDGDLVSSTKKAMTACNFPFESLTPDQIRERFPTIDLTPGLEGVYDKEAGILKADKCLQALQVCARRQGGEVKNL